MSNWQQVIHNYAAHNRMLIDMVKEKNGHINQLENENARLRKALKFYADEENQRPFHDFDPSPYMSDGGENARRVLKGE